MRDREEKELFQGRWLSLKEVTYRSRTGQTVHWETVKRTKAETVIILLAKLVPTQRYILLKQFRAGINNQVIALPAGVIGAQSDLSRQAADELKEETGYTGRIVGVSPLLKINPAVLDCNVRVFRMEVDENAPFNVNPRQQLEPEEEIEVILKPRSEIKNFLLEEQVKGTAIDVACWFVFGG